MARYSVGFTQSAKTVGTMIVQLRASSTKPARVFEIGLSASTAVACDLGLIRSATVGATFTSITPLGEDPGFASATTVLDTAATTAPTVGTVYLRRLNLPATIGAGVIWAFPQGIVIPVSIGLLLWNVTGTGPATSGYINYEE